MVAVARRVLVEQGFSPDAPSGAQAAPSPGALDVTDLRDLPWSSIDNAESRDLDQIEVAEEIAGGATRIRVGIADVDAFVPKGSPVDRFAATNTTTLYTGVHTFSMLPDELSMDRTSLLGNVERLAMITEMVVRADGTLDEAATKVYPARVVNHAKLVYEDIGPWLDGDQRALPGQSARIANQLRIQDAAARKLRAQRFERGAMEFDTVEARPITGPDGKVTKLEVVRKNRARELVEDLMIAANGATAKFLEARGFSSIRRVVHAPKRWDRIVELAKWLGTDLPPEPDARALAKFMQARRVAAPAAFAELSMSIVKMMGAGEYALQRASDPDMGHFGLAVDDYTHSTAPNRRFPDLVTQRLLKAAFAGHAAPYADQELVEIAAHCTERQNAARKVERTMRKVAAAEMMSSRVGEEFDAIVTGAADKGTFVRLLAPPAEGRVVRGERGLDVGDSVRVKLVATEPARGFIDFEAVRRG